MILRRIALKNIRSYASQEIDFFNGTTLFAGDVGSGKSSILMGIEFALFGLISQRAGSLLSKKSDRGSVVLDFAANGHKYRVRRGLIKNGDRVTQDNKRSYLEEDGVVEPLAPTDIKRRVLDILGLNEPSNSRAKSRIFRYAIFTPQDEIKRILEDPEKRLETIQKAFRMEEYEQARENAKLVRRELSIRTADYSGRSRDLDGLLSEVPRLRGEIDGLVNDVNAKRVIVSDDEDARRTLQDRLRVLEEQHVEAEGLRKTRRVYGDEILRDAQEIKRLSHAIRELESEQGDSVGRISALKKTKPPTALTQDQLDSVLSRLLDAKAKERAAESAVRGSQQRISELERRLGSRRNVGDEALGRELRAATTRIESLQKVIGDAGKLMRTLQGNRGGFASDISHNAKTLASIARLGAKCPTCKNEITQAYKSKLESAARSGIENAKRSIAAIDGRMDLLSGRIAEAQNDLDGNRKAAETVRRNMLDRRDLSAERDRLQKSRSDLAAARMTPSEMSMEFPELPADISIERTSALKKRLSEYDDSRKSLAYEERRLGQIRDGMASAGENLRLREDHIRGRRQDVAGIDERIKAFAGISDALSKVRSDVYELGERISANREQIGAWDAEIRGRRETLRECERRIKGAKESKAKAKKLEAYGRWLDDYFVPATMQIERQVMLSIQQQFDAVYRRWYSILIDDPSKYTRIDENFTPVVEQDGYDQDVDHLSGGEKTGIALAYRLALNSMMRREMGDAKSGLLILDEPTDGFSKSQLSKIKDILDEMDSEQTILVSHERELETFADHIFLVSKEGGESVVSGIGSA